MEDNLVFEYVVSREDFTRAGEASADVKKKLKALGVPSGVVRRVSIALYEGEINMVVHAYGGNITVEITSDKIIMLLKDKGPGIPDVEKAMQEGFSTASDSVRALGFGAGMGLPNMKKCSDRMDISTTIGVGTEIKMEVDL